MATRREQTAVIVAGMHRSGTSIVALALRRLGVDLADGVEDDGPYPAGYGEDRDFVEFHRAVFDRPWHDPGDPSLGHHHDWGYDPAETFDPAVFDEVGGRAARLLERGAGPGPWGFKDPRATLVLDAWVRRLRDARVVLVVRHPDAVASSMASLGEGPWRDPALAHRIWRFYNRRVLAFARQSTVPCVVVDGGVGTAKPRDLADLMGHHLGLSLDPTGVVFDHLDPDRFAADITRHRLPLRERLDSEILWQRLRRRIARPA